MACFSLQGVDELAKELMELGTEVDDVAIKMVDEAAGIMDEELASAIRNNTQKYGTGALADSIHHFKPRRNDLGAFTVSTARGRDNKGKKGKVTSTSYGKRKDGTTYDMSRQKNAKGTVRNQDKLWYLENGSSHQMPHPIIAKCVRRAEPKVLSKMQAVFNREFRKVW